MQEKNIAGKCWAPKLRLHPEQHERSTEHATTRRRNERQWNK